MPLESARHAEFMANEVPGVRIPDAVVERMRRADADGRAAGRGHRRSRAKSLAEIRPLVQGVQISTSARRRVETARWGCICRHFLAPVQANGI